VQNVRFPPTAPRKAKGAPFGRARALTRPLDGGETPPYHPKNSKERFYEEAVSEFTLAFSGRALAPLPHPPRASTKTKTLLMMVGSVQPLCPSVEPC
jgi:hypothetical protein